MIKQIFESKWIIKGMFWKPDAFGLELSLMEEILEALERGYMAFHHRDFPRTWVGVDGKLFYDASRLSLSIYGGHFW